MEKKYVGIIVMVLAFILVVPVTAGITSPDEPVDESPTEPLINGPIEAKYGEICNYTAMSTDPQGDPITYVIEFSDAPRSVNEQGPYQSGEEIHFSHAWSDFYQETNPYKVRVKAVDDEGHESEWARFITRITEDSKSSKSKIINLEIVEMLHRFLERLLHIDILEVYNGNSFNPPAFNTLNSVR